MRVNGPLGADAKREAEFGEARALASERACPSAGLTECLVVVPNVWIAVR
jgi:hypothetical protein